MEQKSARQRLNCHIGRIIAPHLPKIYFFSLCKLLLCVYPSQIRFCFSHAVLRHYIDAPASDMRHPREVCQPLSSASETSSAPLSPSSSSSSFSSSLSKSSPQPWPIPPSSPPHRSSHRICGDSPKSRIHRLILGVLQNSRTRTVA